MEPIGGPGEGRQDRADRQGQHPVVVEHQRQNPEEGDRARKKLRGTPGQQSIETVDVGIGPGDDSALVGLVEIVE